MISIDWFRNFDIRTIEIPQLRAGIFIMLIIGLVVLTASIFGFNVFYWLSALLKKCLRLLFAAAQKKEKKQLEAVRSGRKDKKTLGVYEWLFRICNTLWGTREISPYVFLTVVTLASLGLGILVSVLFLGNVFFAFIMVPICEAALLAFYYTKANKRDRHRIKALLEAINTVSSNMKGGVVPAVRESLNSIDASVRYMFLDFLDAVEVRNTHVVTALEDLRQDMKPVGDDFIRKVKTFEQGEERGLSDVFKDVIEVNNMKLRMMQKQEDAFKKVEFDFRISTMGIFGFLIGVLAIYADVRTWYFSTSIGSLVLVIDAVLLLAEYVYMVSLRARAL